MSVIAKTMASGRSLHFWQRLILSEYFVLLLTAAYFLIMIPIVPQIMSPASLRNIVSDMLPLLVVAIGQTFVLIIAGIDLSVTSIIAMSGVVGASVMTGSGGPLGGSDLAMPAGIAAMLATGALIGFLNGVSITRLGMPPFMVTLTTMMFFSGAAIWFVTLRSETTSIANLPREFVAIGQGDFHGIPNALWVAAAVAVVTHLMLSRTVFGRQLFAIGINPRAARTSGVRVGRQVLLTFVLSGICAAIAAVLYTGRLESASPIVGANILLDIVGAAVIGGTSLFGGRGKILWTVFGVLFLVVLDTSLKLMGVTLFAVLSIKGGVILFAAVIDAARTRLAGR